MDRIENIDTNLTSLIIDIRDQLSRLEVYVDILLEERSKKKAKGE